MTLQQDDYTLFLSSVWDISGYWRERGRRGFIDVGTT